MKRINIKLVLNGNQFFARCNGGQGSLDRQHAVFAQGGLDELRIGALGQQEFTVVFPVDGFGFCFLLVLGMDLYV